MGEIQDNTQLVPYEAWKVRQVVDDLLSAPAPANAISALSSRAGAPNASVFERYAGLVLHDAGAAKLTSLPPSCTILLTPPKDAHLARLTCTTDLSDDDRLLIIDLENAINRLCSIADAIEDSGTAWRDEEYGISICHMGAGFLPNHEMYRSANIKLPSIGRAEQPTMAYFNEIDWRVLDHVAATAHPVFQSSLLPNMHQAFMGAYGPDNSDWDVRTRLASILEGLELPLRFNYRFDVNIEQQAASIAFVAPRANAFPSKAADALTGMLADTGARIEDARIVYSMRLAALLAAAAFGSGKRIEHAFVTAVRQGDPRPVLTCAFERKEYVYKTLTAIDSGALHEPTLRFDVDSVAKLIAAKQIDFVRFDGEDGLETPSDSMSETRIAPHLDDRELAADMQALFHAKRICDIDTRHYQGPGAQAVTEARIDSDESTIAAIAHLEQVASDLERETVPPDDNASARPLYCQNPLARAVVTLLDDTFAVSAQAEAFLMGDDSPEAMLEDHPLYFRAPDALFHAHMGLSDLYERLGDIPGSEAQADRCIALAPTSADAYFRKADVLAQQSRYIEAANLLSEGLRYAISPRDCALLYYHLALILWNTGRKREAVAVHVYTASLAGEYAEKAQRVVASLRKRGDSPVIVYASPLAASREMARARIPIAPSDAARTLIVKAAVGLSCANAPEACAPYAAAVASYFRDDSIIASACNSIINGTTLHR